jgi:hypothetical protein
MSNHLSQEQFARCFVGAASDEERRHVRECAECRAELDDFGNTVATLRHAIRSRVDEQPSIQTVAVRHVPKTRWALAAAATLLIGVIPFLTERPGGFIEETPAETSAEALMNAINLHLSRTVPSPMEPMMSLISSDASLAESGGMQ